MVVNCVAYAEGRKIGAVEIDDISELLKFPGHFVWIGLHEPDQGLLRRIQQEFGLHELAIEDALSAHQRPKIEEYGDSLFIVLRTAQLINGDTAFGETHIFVGPQYVVSIRHGASAPYTDVRARCESVPQLLKKGSAFVLYALMDFIVDHYFPIVDGLEDQLEDLEDAIFAGNFDRPTTERVYRLKRQLVSLKRAVAPLVDVCNRLMRFDSALIHEDTRPYFRDVYDHVIRINEAGENLRDLLATALDVQLSLVSVNQNDTMRKLAAWAAILAVPTMLAGIYGMNFEHMPELHWRFGYGVLLLVMGSACSLLYRQFRRVGWL